MAQVHLDYHVEIDKHFYSVRSLFREKVEARITAKTVEIFHRGKLVGSPSAQPAPASADHARRVTCRARIGATATGRMSGIPRGGGARSADDTAALVETILRSAAHIPSRGSAPASAFSGHWAKPRPIAERLDGAAHGRWHWVPAPTVRSRQS